MEDKILLYIAIHPYTNLVVNTGLVDDYLVTKFKEKLKEDLKEELYSLYGYELVNFNFIFNNRMQKLLNLTRLYSKKAIGVDVLVAEVNVTKEDFLAGLDFYKQKDNFKTHKHITRVCRKLETIAPMLLPHLEKEQIEKLYRLTDIKRATFSPLFKIIIATDINDQEDLDELVSELRSHL